MHVPETLLRVARALAPLREECIVFAGASILPLILDDPATPPVRFTLDVDATVDVVTYRDWERLQSKLRECGLIVRADATSGKGRMCLFHLGEIEVDIMPVRLSEILPPSRMLELGFHSAKSYFLESGLEILALSPAGLLAAKLEAFRERGIRDLPSSKDLDDIVSILDCRLAIDADVSEAPQEIRRFISAEFLKLLKNGQVLDLISDSVRDRVREHRILGLMRSLSNSG